jgi:hypothetical protein
MEFKTAIRGQKHTRIGAWFSPHPVFVFRDFFFAKRRKNFQIAKAKTKTIFGKDIFTQQ